MQNLPLSQKCKPFISLSRTPFQAFSSLSDEISMRSCRPSSSSLPSTDLVEYENVLKLFFVPVWRLPRKLPALYCRDCSFLPSSSKYHYQVEMEEQVETDMAAPVAFRCGSCDRPVEPGFCFCPFYGYQLGYG